MRPFRSLLLVPIIFAVLGLATRSQGADRAERRHPTRHAKERTEAPPRDRHDRHDAHARDDDHRYDRYRYHAGNRGDRRGDQFPRHYGYRYFPRLSYHGHQFGPHFRFFTGALWFYWPYSNAPVAGCEWYLVPTVQTLVMDGDGQEYWVYSDYRRQRLCFD